MDKESPSTRPASSSPCHDSALGAEPASGECEGHIPANPFSAESPKVNGVVNKEEAASEETSPDSSDGPLGPNPFPVEDPRHDRWKYNSRLAEEELARFEAEQLELRRLSRSLNNPFMLPSWYTYGQRQQERVSFILGIFDILAKRLMESLDVHYDEVRVFKGRLLEIGQELVQNESESVIDELAKGLWERFNYWKAAALKRSREGEQQTPFERAQMDRDLVVVESTPSEASYEVINEPSAASAVPDKNIIRKIVDDYRDEVKATTGEDLQDAQIYNEAKVDKGDFYRILRGEIKPTSRIVARLRDVCLSRKPHLGLPRK